MRSGVEVTWIAEHAAPCYLDISPNPPPSPTPSQCLGDDGAVTLITLYDEREGEPVVVQLVTHSGHWSRGQREREAVTAGVLFQVARARHFPLKRLPRYLGAREQTTSER